MKAFFCKCGYASVDDDEDDADRNGDGAHDYACERNAGDGTGTFGVQFAKAWEARGCTTLLNENERLLLSFCMKGEDRSVLGMCGIAGGNRPRCCGRKFVGNNKKTRF